MLYFSCFGLRILFFSFPAHINAHLHICSHLFLLLATKNFLNAHFGFTCKKTSVKTLGITKIALMVLG